MLSIVALAWRINECLWPHQGSVACGWRLDHYFLWLAALDRELGLFRIGQDVEHVNLSTDVLTLWETFAVLPCKQVLMLRSALCSVCWYKLEAIKPKLLFLWFFLLWHFFSQSFFCCIDGNFRRLEVTAFIYFNLSAWAEPSAVFLIFGELYALCALFWSLFPLEVPNFGAGSKFPHNQIFLTLHELFTSDKVGIAWWEIKCADCILLEDQSQFLARVAINDMEAYGWVCNDSQVALRRRELSQGCGGVRRETRLLHKRGSRRFSVTLLQPVEDSALTRYGQ